MASPNRRGPKPLSDILGELFAARGYGRLRALRELEEAWNAAVGEPRLPSDAGRRGAARGPERDVAHPDAAGRAGGVPQAGAAGRPCGQSAPATPIHDIRFRVGPIDRRAGCRTRPAPAADDGRRPGPNGAADPAAEAAAAGRA